MHYHLEIKNGAAIDEQITGTGWPKKKSFGIVFPTLERNVPYQS